MEGPKQQGLKGTRDEDNLVEVGEGCGDGVTIRTGDRHGLLSSGIEIKEFIQKWEGQEQV